MEQLTSTQLNAEDQLLLEQPTARLPVEAQRANVKKAVRDVEITQNYVLKKLKETASAASSSPNPAAAAAAIDVLLDKMQGLRQRLEAARAEEAACNAQEEARLAHLAELRAMASVSDVRYERWSRTRLDRLFVDWLLRAGYADSARALAREKGIENLVDLGVFEACLKVERSLRAGRTAEALAWCGEFKALRKQGGELEFQLRLQQYIEFRRAGKPFEARQHAQKFLAPYLKAFPTWLHHAAGLLAHGPDTMAQPYRDMYSPDRWRCLAELFVKTHHSMFSIPERPLLEIALGAGLSALKTPVCHSETESSTSANFKSATVSECPICSMELNELARRLPYAYHSKSWVVDDPVMLPNGRVHGRDKLLADSAKAGVGRGRVIDPVTREVFGEAELRKVFIS